MSRLIDADKLKQHYAWWENGTAEMTLAEAKRNFDVIIDVQPTVDAVPLEDYKSMEQTVNKLTKALADAEPVVRCKDCKYWEYDVIFSDGWCRGKHQGNPSWFCADGERREDVDNR